MWELYIPYMHFDRYDEWLSSGRCVFSVSMTNRYFPKGRFRMRYRDVLGCHIVSLSVSKEQSFYFDLLWHIETCKVLT